MLCYGCPTNTCPFSGGQQHAMIIREVCPRCKSAKYTKNGHIHNGQQNHHGHDCGRQFVDGFDHYRIADDTCALIARLLVERISLRGICRAVGVGLKWLLGVPVDCVEALPDYLHVQPATYHRKVMIRRLRRKPMTCAALCRRKRTSRGSGSRWMPQAAR
jgi:hypothetical protein